MTFTNHSYNKTHMKNIMALSLIVLFFAGCAIDTAGTTTPAKQDHIGGPGSMKDAPVQDHIGGPGDMKDAPIPQAVWN